VTTLDDRLRQTASNLYAKYGKTVTLAHITKTYVPSTGDMTSVIATLSLKARIEEYAIQLVDGTNVLAGDLRVTFSALDATFYPVPDDTLTIDSVAWRVVKASPIYIVDQPGLWVLQVRK